MIIKNFTPEILKKLEKFGPKSMEVIDLTLEDIFVSLVGKEKSV